MTLTARGLENSSENFSRACVPEMDGESFDNGWPNPGPKGGI